jgi:Sulfotransferase family
MSTRRFFLIHLVKTGGTTLRKRLEHHFGERAIYPDASDADEGEYFSIERVLERVRARGDEIRVVTGHFPLCTAEILGGGFTTLTIVRDPVERILSHLRHHREWTPGARDTSLEEIYSDPLVFHGIVHNHMVKMFSLTSEEAFSPTPHEAAARDRAAGRLRTAGMLTRVEFTPGRLERAKAGLASVDALGLHARMDEFFDELARRFEWDLGPPQHHMRSDPLAKREARTEVSDEFRARLAEDNAMDVELYRFAERLHDRRTADAASGQVAR